MFQPWFLFTISGAAFSAIARILQKKLMLQQKTDPLVLSFIFQFLAATSFFVIGKITGSFEFPDLSGVWYHVIAMTVLYSFGNIFSFKAFKDAEASEATILFTTGTIWSIITAMFFLGERLSTLQFLGIIILVFGIGFTYFEKTGWRFNKGHVFALISSFFFGIAFTNDVYILNLYQDVGSYMFLAFLLPSILTFMFIPKKIKLFVPYFSTVKKSSILFSSVFLYCFSSIFFFTAYKVGGQASLISPVFQLSVIFTVILSIVFLGERKHLLQKIIGSIITFTGVIFTILM